MRVGSSINRPGGLQDLADEYNVSRIGPSHQAGSDSLLTSQTFFKFRDTEVGGEVDDGEFNGKLFGLGQTFTNANNGIMSGGATIAEREDRFGGQSQQPIRSQTPVNGGTAAPIPSTQYGPAGYGLRGGILGR